VASPFETALKRLLRVRTKNLASFNNEAGVCVHEPSLVMAGLVPAIHAFCHTFRLPDALIAGHFAHREESA